MTKLFCQISGNISSDQTWSETIHINGDVTIDPFVVVSINAGTNIIFDGYYRITVYGALQVNGISNNLVTFTSNSTEPTMGDWVGLIFSGQSGSSESFINYSTFNYANETIIVNQLSGFFTLDLNHITIENISIGVNITSGDVTISNSEIRNVANYGIDANGSNVSLSLTNTSIYQQAADKLFTGYGIFGRSGATITLNGVSLQYFNYGFYNNTPITLSGSGNTIQYNGNGFGLHPSSDVDIEGSIIANNTGWNVRMYTFGGSDNEMDFTGNWWGTTDGIQISETISDHTDGNYPWVNFLPFLDADGGTSVSYNYIANRIHSPQTLSATGSPYVAIGDIWVDANSSLTIDPGVEIRFINNTSLEVHGGLTANGTETNPIVFTTNSTNPAPGQWSHIRFSGPDPQAYCSMEYCDIGYSSAGILVSYSNSLENLSINNITLHDIAGDALQFAGWEGDLDGIYINNVATGVNVTSGSVNISNSEIRNVTNYGIDANGANVSLNLTNTSIYQQAGDKLFTGYGMWGRTGATITLNGVSLQYFNYGFYNNTPITLSGSGNTIQYNGNGFGLHPSSDVDIEGSIIANNTGWNVRMYTFGGSDNEMDFTGNWWGTTDSVEISGTIIDHTDGNYPWVIFHPFLTEIPSDLFCYADFNYSGRVDGYDLAIFGVSFGAEDTSDNYNIQTDINGSGRVDGFDLALFGINFSNVGYCEMPGGSTSRNDLLRDFVTLELEYSENSCFSGDTIFAYITLNGTDGIFASNIELSINPNLFQVLNISPGSAWNPEYSMPVYFQDSNTNGHGLLLGLLNPENITITDSRILRLELLALSDIINTNNLIVFRSYAIIAEDGFTLISDYSTTVRIESNDRVFPDKFRVSPGNPNPTNSSISFDYQITAGSELNVSIYDIRGRQVFIEILYLSKPGKYNYKWACLDNNSNNISSGLYFVLFKNQGLQVIRKITVLK